MPESTETATDTFSTLGNHVHRTVLDHLVETETAVPVDRLATAVAASHDRTT